MWEEHAIYLYIHIKEIEYANVPHSFLDAVDNPITEAERAKVYGMISSDDDCWSWALERYGSKIQLVQCEKRIIPPDRLLMSLVLLAARSRRRDEES